MKSVYSIDVLMEKTRELAAHYRASTGQVLPVSGELARYDVARLFHFYEPSESIKGVDLIGTGTFEECPIQVKSRVIFNDKKSHRIGQLNVEGLWQQVFLVLYDEHYQPFEVWACTRESLLSESDTTSHKKPLSIAKFKVLGLLVWSSALGIEESDVWENHS